MEAPGDDTKVMKMAKWLFNQGYCNGSAVVSPYPVYQVDRAASDSAARPRRGAEKVIGLLGPDTTAQRRQIHALLEQSVVNSDSDEEDSFEFESTRRITPPHHRHPPRLELRPKTRFLRDENRPSSSSSSSSKSKPPVRRLDTPKDTFEFPSSSVSHFSTRDAQRNRSPGVYRSQDRVPLPLRAPVEMREVSKQSASYYSPASSPSVQYFESSPVYRSVQSGFHSPWHTPAGSSYATPLGSPRQQQQQLSPRDREDSGFYQEPSRASFSRVQQPVQQSTRMFAYSEPQSPYRSPYVSAPQSPYSPSSSSVQRSFFQSPSPYHQAYCPSPLNAAEVELNELVGWGSYGAVYRGKYTQTGMPVAVKALHGDEVSAKEIELLSRLDHQHIVKYYSTTTLSDGRFSIVLELMKCAISSLIKDSKGLEEPLIRDYTRQILFGLKYLHHMNIVHRDIKCANILLDFKGVAKLGDFGLAKRIDYSCAKSCKGTFFYMAPEVLLTSGQAKYGLAADIWSLGCTVIEMAGGKHPWSGFGIMPFYECMRQGQCPPIPSHLSPEAVDFVKKCFTRQPDQRPTASTLLRHPFVSVYS